MPLFFFFFLPPWWTLLRVIDAPRAAARRSYLRRTATRVRKKAKVLIAV